MLMYIVAAKQCCTEPKPFAVKLRGNRIMTGNLNWPRGYSIPYDIIKKESLKKRANSGGFLPLLRK